VRIAVVQAAVEAINRGEWEAAFAGAAPDIVYDLSRTESPLRGIYEGIDAVKSVAAEFFGPWESVRYDVEALTEAGDDVVMRYTSHFRSRAGLDLQARAIWVWTFRGDEVSRLTLLQA
jgi:ketosteroid isomerase-like protein